MSGTDSSGPPPSNSQQAAVAPGKTSNSSESLVHTASEPPDSTSPHVNSAASASTKMEPAEDAKDVSPSETATGTVNEDEVMQDGFVADSAKPALDSVTGKADPTDAEPSATTGDTAQLSQATNGTVKPPSDASTAAPHEQEADAAQHAEGGDPPATEPASTEERPVSETERLGTSQDANRDEQSASASEAATPLGSPPLRDASPALSAASETPSQGAPPVASTSAVAYGESAPAVDLAYPFIEYPFANTALVPAGATEPVPFHYATWPPEPREMSWIRSRRGDDPEQDLAPNTEFGYFATPEEIEASRQREELRQAKIRARIQEYEQERTAAYSSFGNGAGRGRGGAKRGRGRAVRVRARGRGDSASREGSLDPSYEEAPTAPSARRGRPPGKSALKVVQPDSSGEKMAIDQPEPKPPKPRVTDATMARMLLPNDLQTALPASIKPHPAEIDPLDLPSYYIPSLNIVPCPAPASNVRKHATRSPVKTAQTDANAANAAVQSSPATESKPSAAAAPLREEPEPSTVENSRDSATNGKQPKAPKQPTNTVALKSAAGSGSAEADRPPPSAVSTMQPANFHSDGKDAASSKRPRSPHDEGRKVAKRPALTEGSKEKVKHSSTTEKTGEVEIGKDGHPIEYAVQTTTCLSKKMDGQVRCWQCIARGIGHGCSFAGVRWFGYDRKGRIVTGPVFRSISDEEDDDPDWDKAYTMPMSDVHSNLLKTWVADALLDVLKKEVKYAKTHNPIRVRHDLALQAVCDTCYESCVITEFMCKVCGRTACPVCYAKLVELDKNPPDEGLGLGLPNVDVQRRRKCVAKKRGRESTGAAGHTASNFIALTKYDIDGIEKLRVRVQSWWDKHELAPVDTKVQDYLRKKFVLPSNLKEYDENTWPVWTFQHRVLDDALFFEVWRNHEPIVVRRCPPLDLAKFTPQYFAKTFANVPVELVHSRTLESKSTNLGDFFGEFQCDYKRRGGQPEVSRKQTWRPKKGFPSQQQWETDFKELHTAFLSWLPLPNVFHPNGVLNILAHAPENAAPPDLTPQLFTSWETDAATPTIQLQTHDYDLLSHMVWGGSDHRTGKLLRIRWDVWRKEDAPKLREFCLEVLLSSHPRGTTMNRIRQVRDDPLLNPAVYLTKRQRAVLYERTGIKPYPLYQYMGDTVLIPAGCPYQVSSWIDHINLSIPFLAGSSCSRALQVHKDSRPETKERSLWREDKVQLEAMLLYTYLSCEEYDHFGVGVRRLRGKLNWPFPRDEKNRPIVPTEELARLQELTDAEARGTEISNEVKKAGTAAYDEAWNAGIAEAECKKRAEKARDDKALELRRKREAELGLPPQPGGLTPAAAAELLPKPPKPSRPIIDGRS